MNKTASKAANKTPPAEANKPIETIATETAVATKPATQAAAKIASKKTVKSTAPASPVKADVKPAPLSPAKPTSKKTAAPKAAKESKPKKAVIKKPKLVRDSFTFPESDYALFATLKQKALQGGREIKKSELLRAGLNVLSALSQEELLGILAKVESIKTGRPSKK